MRSQEFSFRRNSSAVRADYRKIVSIDTDSYSQIHEGSANGGQTERPFRQCVNSIDKPTELAPHGGVFQDPLRFGWRLRRQRAGNTKVGEISNEPGPGPIPAPPAPSRYRGRGDWPRYRPLDLHTDEDAARLPREIAVPLALEAIRPPFAGVTRHFSCGSGRTTVTVVPCSTALSILTWP